MNAGQRGFGAIIAIVILVIMATLAAGLVRLGTTQQATSTQDILSARAWQVARAGDEWGLFQAFNALPPWCVPGPVGAAQTVVVATLDLRASTGFLVTVTCKSRSFNEGEKSPDTPHVITTYSIDAIACNFPDPVNGCVNNTSATVPGYVERERLVIANTP